MPLETQPLSEWLDWLETIHPVTIDMGLERVSAVADRAALRPAQSPLILVGGTNGKGSTVAMLASIYRAAGYRVGAYTSPHITHFCERIRIDGQMVDEQAVIDALAFVEQHRAPDSLTYFEYTTLAAMRIFNLMHCDVLLFEVGLGGRLDATNLWDADCSIITSIGLDHEAYLGSDRSVIATEKAAIGRRGRPFVVGEHLPPASLLEYAHAHGFDVVDVGSLPSAELPETAMPGAYQKRNAGCAVAAVRCLSERLPVADDILSSALMDTRLEGRFERQVLAGTTVILDVAHNPAGAAVLAELWHEEFGSQRCDIVFAVLADKDISGVITALSPIVFHWHCLTLDGPRAAAAGTLATQVRTVTADTAVEEYDAVDAALQAALASAQARGAPVLVAGSFHTIAAVKSLMQCEPAMIM